MRNNITDYLLLLLLTLIWSISFLLIKIGVASVGPFALTAGRMAVAALTLALCLIIGKIRLPLNRRAVRLYLTVGLLGNALPFCLISLGETRIDSSMAAIMMGIMPISTFVLAHYFISSEPITARKTVGIGMGFFGLLTLVGWSALAGIGDNVLGQLLVLGGATSYGVTTVFVRTQPAFLGVQMAAGAVFAGTMVSIPLAFLMEDPLSMTPSAASLQAIALLGVFSTALAALIYFRVLHNLGATTFAQLNYAIPILGSLWGVFLLGEALQTRMLIALALVLLGIYFIQSGGVAKRR